MKRWSKLQKDLYSIIDPDINFQIHCVKYRMKSQYGSTDLPRYYITLGDEIIFDYPKNFVNEDGNVQNFSQKKPNRFYPICTDISDISNLIREYIDTPKEELFDKYFDKDYWGLSDILKSADRRIGKRRLERLVYKTDSKAVSKVISLRLA